MMLSPFTHAKTPSNLCALDPCVSAPLRDPHPCNSNGSANKTLFQHRIGS